MSDHSPELLSLTEMWFSQLTSSVDESISVVLSVVQQPFVDLRTAGLRLLDALVTLPWCQSVLVGRAGFLEYLLDRSTEHGQQVCLELKYNVVSTLASLTSSGLVQSETMIRLREYVLQGPFYIKPESHVAFENAE